MNYDVLVFRRSMDEGEIAILRFMSADHIERCRIHLYVTFRLDLWFTCVHWLLLITGLLVSLHYCVFVFGFSGLGQGSTDYINMSTDNKQVNEMSINTTTGFKELTDMLFKAFAQAGFARKGQDENYLLPCPKGTFVNSSASDPGKLVCLECPTGSNILIIY